MTPTEGAFIKIILYPDEREKTMSNYLKYPILFVHGMGFRDNGVFCYWGRIPKVCKERGCEVFFGNQDSNANIETNAAVIANRIDEVLKITGAQKVNIIAHSKGGLESRYAISKLGMAEKVASLTTISTPHNGSKTVDVLMKFPNGIIKFGCRLVDAWHKLLGDKKPDTFGAVTAFMTSSAEKFNREVVDDERVYGQSYAFVMKKPTSDIFMWLTNIFVKLIEGDNDGLLTPDSVKWSNFRGVYTGITNRGISHCDQIDMRRKKFTRKKGDGISDITDFYLDMVEELKVMGF